MQRFITMARWAPFVIVGLASQWASARTTDGYRAPVFDWDLSWPAIANALTKVPHVTSMVLIFLLATLAVGTSRLWLAAVLALAVAIGWEIVQMPTIGNNPRLADLAPDLLGIALGWGLISIGAVFWRRFLARADRVGEPES